MYSWYKRRSSVHESEAQASSCRRSFNNTPLPEQSRAGRSTFRPPTQKLRPHRRNIWASPALELSIRVQERSPHIRPRRSTKASANGGPALGVHPLIQAALGPILEAQRPTRAGGSASQSFLLHKSTRPSSPSPSPWPPSPSKIPCAVTIAPQQCLENASFPPQFYKIAFLPLAATRLSVPIRQSDVP